jgi:hypothetical protein
LTAPVVSTLFRLWPRCRCWLSPSSAVAVAAGCLHQALSLSLLLSLSPIATTSGAVAVAAGCLQLGTVAVAAVAVAVAITVARRYHIRRCRCRCWLSPLGAVAVAASAVAVAVAVAVSHLYHIKRCRCRCWLFPSGASQSSSLQLPQALNFWSLKNPRISCHMSPVAASVAVTTLCVLASVSPSVASPPDC